jgi:hypothetical protein
MINGIMKKRSVHPLISAIEVKQIFVSCLFNQNEIINGQTIIPPLVVQGIQAKFGFHPDRIKEAAPIITNYLNQLPADFKSGASFLNLCMTNSGEQWTGEHSICELLMVMGIAIGKAAYTAPKELWNALPGGMPYVVIN